MSIDIFAILDLPNVNGIDVDHVLGMINEKIGRYDQKITEYEYGLTNDDFYVFHTTAPTAISKMQQTYNENELLFFKSLLTRITESDDFKISPLEALNNSTETSKGINKTRTQYLINSWIESHYFFKHIDNRIYLGARALTEFRDFFLQMELNSLKCCILCEAIAIWVRKLKLNLRQNPIFVSPQGPRCTECDVIFHRSCITKYRARSDKCPSCREKLPANAVDT